MNKVLLGVNVILLVAVGYLLYVHFSPGKKTTLSGHADSKSNATGDSSFKIAYFEIDSIDANFELVKDIRNEISKKQMSINLELDRLDKSYRDKYNTYQGQASSMTQTQSEQATNDLLTTQEKMKNRKQELDKDYNDFVTRRMQEVKTKIEEFLKDYNKEKGYSYIISYEPGLFYYKDTVYNITNDVVKGLNALYGKNKKN
jgi:outer membrane protein